MNGWSKAWSARIKPAHLVVLIFLCTAYLSLVRLDNTYFWDDEAEVGIIARNLLATGQLTGWDGRNLYAYRDGRQLDAQLRTRFPPLQFWVTAASFKVFGASTWAGRFPSALLGLAALALLPFAVRAAGKEDWVVPLYATALLGFSVPFLLYIRQCRYFALTLALSALTFYAYQRCLATKRIRDGLLLAAAAVLLFYAQYLTATAFLLGLALMHVVCYRRECGKRDWLLLWLAAGIFALATAPYALANRIWLRPETLSQTAGLAEGPSWLVRKLALLWWNLRNINLVGSLPWTLGAGILFLLVRRRHEQIVSRLVRPWTVLVLGYVFFLALIPHQTTKDDVIGDVRYLAPLLPFFAGLGGAFLSFLHRKSRLIAALVFVLLISCNLPAAAPPHFAFQWLLPAYLREVHHDYPTGYRAAAEFLEANAGQDDLVFADPDFCNFPLMFYLSHKVRFCCLLDRQTPLSRESIERLHAPLFADENFPDWFIAFGRHPTAVRLLAGFSRPHEEQGRPVQFRYELVKNLNVFWQDTSRPELPWHWFGPERHFDPRTESVYVFKRVEAATGNSP